MRTLTALFAFLLTLGLSCLGQNTFLKIHSEAGDPAGGGLERTLTTSDATFSAGYDYAGLLHISVRQQDSSQFGWFWSLSFRGPASGPLKPGVYENAEWLDDRLSTARPRPGIKAHEVSVFPHPRDFANAEGRFEVKTVIYGPGGQLLSFWALFEQRIAGSNAKLTGEICYNADSTATPTKQRPRVYASATPNRLTVGTPVQLLGILQDDGVPTNPPVQVKWRCFSNSENMEFEDPNSLNTGATFRAVGEYQLELSATCPSPPGGDSFVITVHVVDLSKPTFLRASIPNGQRLGLADELYFDLLNADIYCSDWLVEFRAEPDSGRDLKFRLLPPLGQPLSTKRYEGARLTYWSAAPIPFDATLHWNPVVQPFPLLPQDKQWCTIDVLELTYDGSGAVESLWAAIEVQDSIFSAPALLEMRYRASENSLTNRAPFVSAGADREFLGNMTVRLMGNALDSSIPEGSALSVQWSQVSGPTSAVIDDASAARTHATLPAPGTYVFRLTANDGSLSSSDEVTISQIDGQSGLSVHRNSTSNYSFTEWDPNEGFISLESWTGDTVGFVYQQPFSTDRSDLVFMAPKGQQLQKGIYSRVVNTSVYSNDPERVYPHMRSNYLGLGGDQGEFEIKELETAPDGSLISFRATFLLPFPNSLSSTRGEIRYRSRSIDGPQNGAPRVLVSQDTIVPPGGSPILYAFAADDGLPFGKKRIYRWTQESGPPASVASPDQPNTQVLLPGEGVFRFRLTVSDGELESSAEITLFAREMRGTFQGTLMIRESPYGKVTITATRSDVLSVRISTLFKTDRFVAKLKDGVYTYVYPLPDGTDGVLKIVRLDNGTFAGILTESGLSGEFVTYASLSELLKVNGEENPFAKRYNFSLAPISLNEGPPGVGIGALNISRDGRWRALMSLADGTKTSDSGVLGSGGQVNLFSLLPRKGRVAGEIRITRGEDSSILTGALAWSRSPRENAKRFPDGFRQTLIVNGEPYEGPLKGQNIFTRDGSALLGSFDFTTAHGSLPITRSMTIGTQYSWTNGYDFAVRFDPVSGFFSGRYENRDYTIGAFRGAIFQSNGTGRGYFINPSFTGAVNLQTQPK